MLVKHCNKFVLRLSGKADALFNNFAAFEEINRRNTHNSVLCCQLHLIIRIDFSYFIFTVTRFRYLGDYDRGGQSRSGWRQSGSSYGYAAPVKKSRSAPPAKVTPPAQPAADYKTGDRIVHKAFGHGVIETMTPMGGDALIQIRFDSGETKKLMLRIAAQHMQKE